MWHAVQYNASIIVNISCLMLPSNIHHCVPLHKPFSVCVYMCDIYTLYIIRDDTEIRGPL